jgi:hypothetical protein
LVISNIFLYLCIGNREETTSTETADTPKKKDFNNINIGIMKNNIQTAGKTVINLDKEIKTISYGGYKYPVLDIDCTQGVDKKIRDYCLKTLRSGDWCKSFYVRLAFTDNYERNDCKGVSDMTEPEEHRLLYEGFQDYVWHNMPKKCQKYINERHYGLFFHICHNYVSFEQIVGWFNKNLSKALKINNDYHVDTINGACRGNTAWC